MSDSTNKQQLSVRISSVAYGWAKRKPNVSRYIEGLIAQDMQLQSTKPIVRAVKEELMADEEFFNEVARRMTDRGRDDLLVGVFD